MVQFGVGYRILDIFLVFKFLTENNAQSPAQSRPWSYRRDLFLLMVYLLLAIVLTWPTITHLNTHLPGDGGDDPAIAWNLWWIKYALLNQGQNPFQTDFMFYPIGINLAFYTLTVLNAVTALPFTLNLGVVTASNLHTLFTFVVGGYGTFLLVRYVLTHLTTADHRSRPTEESLLTSGQRPAGDNLMWISAAIAGGLYAFASSKLFYVALGQFNITSNHWVPFAVLYILRTRHNPHRLKNPLMAGLFLTLQAWAEITYATFILVFIALYWLYWVSLYTLSFVHKRQKPMPRFSQSPILHFRAAIVMGLTFAIGLSPILAQMLPDMLAEGDFFVEGSGFAETFSADLLGFFIPTMHHPLLGGLITQTNITDFNKGQHIYIGFTLLGLMLISLFTGYHHREIRFWLIAAFIFALLCLGPVVTINGQATGIPGPFVILQNLPFFKGNRYPSRYSVMLMLSLSVLAGFALTRIGHCFGKNFRIHAGARRVTHHASRITYPFLLLIPLLFLLFLFEHLSLPLPQSDIRVPAPYQIIAADPDDFTVLDIPFAWRNGFRITGALTTQFMVGQFYQTTHQKRLLQGNTSRNPEFKFQYFTNAPVLNSLLALETGHPLPTEQQQADQAIAAEVLHFFDINYIVVRPYTHPRYDGTNSITVTEQAVIPYVENVLPVEKIHDEATIKIYRLKNAAEKRRLKSGLQIDTASPLAPLYFGEGWGLLSPGQPIAAPRNEVHLLAPLNDGPQRVTLRTRLPDTYKAAPQSVSLTLNGWQSPPQRVGATWQEVVFDLPAGIAQPGLNDIRLHFTEVTELPFPSSSQPLLDVTILSAGQEVGNFGHIFVNGHEVSSNQRGYNVAIIQPNGMLQVANFDTHLDPTASVTLAKFVNTAPPDAVIAIAAADEASANLSEEAVLALHAIGATGDLRGCFRCSHAMISQLGKATEALDPLRPVGVTTGLGLTEPTMVAIVDWIRVQMVEE
jgi:hypothetical protein